jgi:tRNA 2-thiouridine synthesizing protein D
MKFALHVLSAPYSGQGCLTAFNFAKAALLQGHQITRVFFSGEGVLIGNGFTTPAQDDSNLHLAWTTLAEQYAFEMILCISASLKRGIIDSREATRYEKPGFNVTEPFILSGLGQLVEAGLVNDHLITFGG